MKSGGWVFISHSHRDIDPVRRIRNRLEALGLEPLMFYLKCLSDENEIESLIKREIDERDWFIYADSENARASKWVRTEREYIATQSDKKIFILDLTEDLDRQLARVEHIARQMKVFISYSHRDRFLQSRLREKLLAQDMLVLVDEDALSAGGDWSGSLSEVIDDASRNGFVVLLITEDSASSPALRQELQRTLRMGGKIVPVCVGKATLPRDLQDQIGETQEIRIEEEPSDEELDGIVASMLRRVEF